MNRRNLVTKNQKRLANIKKKSTSNEKKIKMLTPRKNLKYKRKKNNDCNDMVLLILSLSMHSNESIIKPLNGSTPSKTEHNSDNKTPLRMKNSGWVGGAPALENNLSCKACLNNMHDEVTHEENVHSKNRNIVTIQLDEKFLTEKKPSLKDTDEKK